MNWKETLTFPPEVPISDKAKDLILRCQPYGLPVNQHCFSCLANCTVCLSQLASHGELDACGSYTVCSAHASHAEPPCQIHPSLRSVRSCSGALAEGAPMEVLLLSGKIRMFLLFILSASFLWKQLKSFCQGQLLTTAAVVTLHALSIHTYPRLCCLLPCRLYFQSLTYSQDRNTKVWLFRLCMFRS